MKKPEQVNQTETLSSVLKQHTQVFFAFLLCLLAGAALRLVDFNIPPAASLGPSYSLHVSMYCLTKGMY